MKQGIHTSAPRPYRPPHSPPSLGPLPLPPSGRTCHSEGSHVSAALQGWGKALVIGHADDGGRGAVGGRKVNHVACTGQVGKNRAGQRGSRAGQGRRAVSVGACLHACCQVGRPATAAQRQPLRLLLPPSSPAYHPRWLCPPLHELTSHEQVCRILLQPCHNNVCLQKLQHRLRTQEGIRGMQGSQAGGKNNSEYTGLPAAVCLQALQHRLCTREGARGNPGSRQAGACFRMARRNSDTLNWANWLAGWLYRCPAMTCTALLLLTAQDSSELRSCSRCTVCSFAKADREGVSPVSRRTLLFRRCPITSACSVERALILSAAQGKRGRAGVECGGQARRAGSHWRRRRRQLPPCARAAALPWGAHGCHAAHT
jgi:hypothetical protein